MNNDSDQYFDLSHFVLLEVSGVDAADFMNNQITADMNDLKSKGWLISAWCLPNGRVISTFILYEQNGFFYLMLPSMFKDKIIKRLSMYILRSDVHIRDVSNDYGQFGLAGPNMKKNMKTMEIEIGEGPPAFRQTRGLTILGLWGPTPRAIVIGKMENLSSVTERILMAFKAGDRSNWALMDIESGIPWITESTCEAFIPQMLNLDQMRGLSFNKGCYPGQEIISRLHYRGRLKRRMYLGTGKGNVVPGAGDQLENSSTGNHVGDVIDAEPLPDAGFRLLAVAEIAEAENTNLCLKDAAKSPICLQPISYPNL